MAYTNQFRFSERSVNQIAELASQIMALGKDAEREFGAIQSTFEQLAGQVTVIAGGGGGGGVGGGATTPHNLLSVTHPDTLVGTPVLGDIIYADSVPEWTKLTGNTTTTRKFLRQVGTGVISAAPAWDTIVDADLPATIVRTSRTLTVAGTSNRITSSAGAQDLSANRTWTLDIAATYVGQSSITTLGTITTGVWNGTLVGVQYGGTGANLSATGGTSQYVKQAGVGAAFTVGTIPASDIASGAALTKTDDTNVTLTLGGSPTTALLAATSLTLGWTGTLAAGRLNANVVQSVTNDTNVTGSISAQNLTLGWTGTLARTRGGTGTGSATTDGQLLIGNTGTGNWSVSTLTAGSGITITNAAGSITIAASGGSGTPGGSDGNIQYNNGGAFGGASFANWDDVNNIFSLGLATSDNGRIDIYNVENAFKTQIRLADPAFITGDYILALPTNTSGGTFAVTATSPITIDADSGDITLGTVGIGKGGTGQTTALAAFNALSPLTTRGDMLTRDASNNIRIAIGAAGKYWRSDGTDPSWQTIAASDVGSGAALTKTDDTNVTLTLGGTPTAALLAATSLTLGWTGTLAVGRGGIGVGTLASNGVLYGNGASAVQALAVNATATNKFLTQVSSGAPAWNTITVTDLPNNGANPTASVGLSAVNGSATTWMRSDGAPALSQAIAPTWTALHVFATAARSSGVAHYLSIVTPADTGMTASTESIGIQFGGTNAATPLTVTRQWATGALTTQRENYFSAPTYGFVGASVLTNAATVAIANAPIAGTNATITNAYALWVQAGKTYLAGDVQIGGANITLSGISTDSILTVNSSGVITSLLNFVDGYVLSSKGDTTIPAYRSVLGTTNQVTVTTASGSFTWSLPQDHHTAAVIQFARLGLGVAADSNSALILNGGTSPTFGQFRSSSSPGIAMLHYSADNSMISFDVEWLTSNFIARNGTVCGLYKTSGQFKMVVGSGNVSGSAVTDFSAAFILDLTTKYFGFGKNMITPTANMHIVQAVESSGSPTAILLTAGAHATIAASTEASDINFNLNRSVQFGTGALTTQRAMRIQAPTYTFIAASTVTDTATVSISGAPTPSTNATFTRTMPLWVEAGTARFDGGENINRTPAASTFVFNTCSMVVAADYEIASSTILDIMTDGVMEIL